MSVIKNVAAAGLTLLAASAVYDYIDTSINNNQVKSAINTLDTKSPDTEDYRAACKRISHEYKKASYVTDVSGRMNLNLNDLNRKIALGNVNNKCSEQLEKEDYKAYNKSLMARFEARVTQEERTFAATGKKALNDYCGGTSSSSYGTSFAMARDETPSGCMRTAVSFEEYKKIIKPLKDLGLTP